MQGPRGELAALEPHRPLDARQRAGRQGRGAPHAVRRTAREATVVSTSTSDGGGNASAVPACTSSKRADGELTGD
ncbi:hypothetical protein Acsp06_16590 [Actinomycetospora sp. NBRC 106375]|nr:hypothetical protein Acsp06_16590 [Actinomycetospora sp. NBRC 106375]